MAKYNLFTANSLSHRQRLKALKSRSLESGFLMRKYLLIRAAGFEPTTPTTPSYLPANYANFGHSDPLSTVLVLPQEDNFRI